MFSILPSKIVRRGVYSLITSIYLACPHAGAFEIERLLAFSTTNTLRVVATVKDDTEAPNVSLRFRIIHAASGMTYAEGSLGDLKLEGGHTASLTNNLSFKGPELWSPSSPTLYRLEVSATTGPKQSATNSVRFGFRSFESREGQFLL